MPNTNIDLLGTETEGIDAVQDLHPRLRDGLKSAGIRELTAVQRKLLEKCMTGLDVVCIAGDRHRSTMGSVIAILNAMLHWETACQANWETAWHALLVFPNINKAKEFSEFLGRLAPSTKLVRRTLIEDGEVDTDLIQPHLHHLLVATPQALLPRVEYKEVNLEWFHYILFDGPYETLQPDDPGEDWMKFWVELTQQNSIRVVNSPVGISIPVLKRFLRPLPEFEKLSADAPDEKLVVFELKPAESRRAGLLRFIQDHLPKRRQLLILTDSFHDSNGLHAFLKQRLGRRYAVRRTCPRQEETEIAITSFRAGDTKIFIHHGEPLDSLNGYKVRFVLFFTVPVALGRIFMAMNYISDTVGCILLLVDPESDKDRMLSGQWDLWQQTVATQVSDRLCVTGLPTNWSNPRVLEAMAQYEPKNIERYTETGDCEDYGYITFPSIDHATRCLHQQHRIMGQNVIRLQYAYPAEDSEAGY